MMKTKRNGDAVTLYCGAEGCDSFYADVLKDRVMVYSFHYGRIHSTPIHTELFREISLLACEGVGGTVECNCGLLDCATVRADQVILESKHTMKTLGGQVGEVHQNVWGLEEIEQIGVWLGLINGTMPAVEFDLTEVKRAS